MAWSLPWFDNTWSTFFWYTMSTKTFTSIQIIQAKIYLTYKRGHLKCWSLEVAANWNSPVELHITALDICSYYYFQSTLNPLTTYLPINAVLNIIPFYSPLKGHFCLSISTVMVPSYYKSNHELQFRILGKHFLSLLQLLLLYWILGMKLSYEKVILKILRKL